MHFRKYIIIFLFTLVGIGIMGYGYVYAAGSNGGFEVPDINDEIGDYKPVSKPNKTDSLDRKECIISGGGGCNFSISENPKADGSEPLYELGFMSQVEEHASTIDKVAKETGVDANLIRAIMYVETTHGWYDMPLSWFDANKSILPMNINIDYWGEDVFGSRDDLKDPYKNIKAGALMIKSIQANLPEDASVSQIATLYNNINATTVNDYGARVAAVYKSQPWK